MPNPDSLENNANVDLTTMSISLRTAATRTAVTLEELIARALATGITKDVLKAYLLEDLETGGRIFGEFRRAVSASGNGIIRDFSASGQWSEDDDVLVAKYMWIAVMINTCPDCMERHGRIFTMDEWEEKGIPGAGFTVCRSHCQCDLVDADVAILKPKPIYRSSRDK
jgi:tRNA(Ile)-lysidine synthase TilS/MesJ